VVAQRISEDGSSRRICVVLKICRLHRIRVNAAGSKYTRLILTMRPQTKVLFLSGVLCAGVALVLFTATEIYELADLRTSFDEYVRDHRRDPRACTRRERAGCPAPTDECLTLGCFKQAGLDDPICLHSPDPAREGTACDDDDPMTPFSFCASGSCTGNASALTAAPTVVPTALPTTSPTALPTQSPTASPTPSPTATPSYCAIRQRSGSYDNFYITSNGPLFDNRVWGVNDYGQLGLSFTSSGIPAPSAANVIETNSYPSQLTAVVAGLWHSCAFFLNGRGRCWGRNTYGQLGIGDTVNRLATNVTTVIDFGESPQDVARFVAGIESNCALMAVSGNVRCWGRNFYGTLGIGNTTNLYTPGPPVDMSLTGSSGFVVDIAGGDRFMCALFSDSIVSCWGENTIGQLGVGDNTPRYMPNETINFAHGSQVTKIFCAVNHCCVLFADNTIKCWGYGDSGGLGTGSTADVGDPSSIPVLTLPYAQQIVQIDLGEKHTCVLFADGAATCWGEGADGRLCSGNTTTRLTPTAEMINTTTSAIIVKLSLGDKHTCLLLSNGEVRCCGLNLDGQLGTGDFTSRSAPTDAVNMDLPYPVTTSCSLNPAAQFSVEISF